MSTKEQQEKKIRTSIKERNKTLIDRYNNSIVIIYNAKITRNIANKLQQLDLIDNTLRSDLSLDNANRTSIEDFKAFLDKENEVLKQIDELINLGAKILSNSNAVKNTKNRSLKKLINKSK